MLSNQINFFISMIQWNKTKKGPDRLVPIRPWEQKGPFEQTQRNILFFSIFLLEIYFSSPYFMELELLIKVVYIYIIKRDKKNNKER